MGAEEILCGVSYAMSPERRRVSAKEMLLLSMDSLRQKLEEHKWERWVAGPANGA